MWTRSQILLEDPCDRKPFPITLDTKDMDSCGIDINIILIIFPIYSIHMHNID